MAEYVMGLDAGRTKSQFAIFNIDGSLVDCRLWRPINHEEMGGSFRELERELMRLVRESAKDHRIKMEEIAYAVFGMTGVDTPERHEAVSKSIGRIGIKQFVLCDAAYLGVPAASPDNTGINAVNGTGCSVAGIDRMGNMLQIGGAGALSGDIGGGVKMSESVIGAVYKSLFRCGEETVLTELLFKELNIKGKYKMNTAIYGKLADESLNLPILNKLMFEAAGLGDKVAVRLLTDVANNYAGGIGCMLGELDFPKNEPVNIVFSGSVFVKAEHPMLIYLIKRYLTKHFHDRRFLYTVLEKPQVMGAVMWAFQKLGIGGDITEKIIHGFDKPDD